CVRESRSTGWAELPHALVMGRSHRNVEKAVGANGLRRRHAGPPIESLAGARFGPCGRSAGLRQSPVHTPAAEHQSSLIGHLLSVLASISTVQVSANTDQGVTDCAIKRI